MVRERVEPRNWYDKEDGFTRQEEEDRFRTSRESTGAPFFITPLRFGPYSRVGVALYPPYSSYPVCSRSSFCQTLPSRTQVPFLRRVCRPSRELRSIGPRRYWWWGPVFYWNSGSRP